MPNDRRMNAEMSRDDVKQSLYSEVCLCQHFLNCFRGLRLLVQETLTGEIWGHR
jgi:hypothetical protein